MQNGAKLTLEYQNKSPVELADLSLSLLAVSEEYQLHVECSVEPIGDDGVRLFVNDIRAGSIVAELISMAPYVLPFVEHANHIWAFIVRLKGAYDYLLGEPGEKPALQRVNYQNLSNILEPIAKDNGSQLNIVAVNATNGTIEVKVTSVNANAIQNRIRRELALLKAPTTGTREKVVLYWYQARNDPKAKTGDKAIIESLHDGPVKVVFMSESIKSQIIASPENFFRVAYIVDVSVETIEGKPILYRVLSLHEKIDRA